MTGKKILVIDDDENISKLCMVLLEKEGYAVSLADCAETGLVELNKNKYDIVLLDIQMPGKSGIEVLPEIRQNHPGLDVMMISGYGDMEVVMESFRRGAYDYIAKPFSKDYLLASVKRCIEKKVPAEEAHEYVESMEYLFRISKAIMEKMPIEKLVELIISAGINTLKADSGSLMLVDDEQNELVIMKTMGLKKEKIQTNRIKIGEGISGWVAQKRRPLLFTDNYDDYPEFSKNEPRKNLKSAVIVPIMQGNKLLGILNINNVVSERVFTDQDLKFMTVFAKDCARAITKSKK